MAILTRDQIMNLDDLPVEVIDVPEWGGEVKVRGMSAEERVRWAEHVKAADGKGIDVEKAQYYAVIVGVVEPKFEEADVDWLRKKSASALERIAQRWLALSGIGTEALVESRKN